MIGAEYAIPILTKTYNHELRKYVKAEFNDRDCHWFTCGSSAKRVAEEPSRRGRSLIVRLLRREPAPVTSPTFVPCAIVIANRREDDQCCSTSNK